MKKVELLAPAGDKESLIAAIQNGADAIYLGGPLFNARASAKNFSYEDLVWAVHYAHLRGVRLFVTVNILYYDQEFDELLAYIDYLYDIQIDALIIQDIGLFDYVHKKYPDFELHISTQASVMNHYGVSFFEERGAKRVVLARENTLEEIKYICQSTSLDIEVFVHGAMCVCYSGQCLMSSVIGKRSGNRGECAQPCRLQYKLMKNHQELENKYPFLLSPKDLMTIENIGLLIEAGVYSFKIEGRMKRPEYVASVVKAYRQAIDDYLNQQKNPLDKAIQQMKAMFNRDYTQGYIFQDQNILLGDYSGNKGIVIGQVIGYRRKEKRVKIRLYHTLQQGDSIIFESIDKGRPVNKIYLQNKLVSHAQPSNIVEIEFDYPVYEGNVRRNIDIKVIQELQKTYQKENRRIPISMEFSAYVNKPACLVVRYQNYEVVKCSKDMMVKADYMATTTQRVQQQLNKLGQTVFICQDIHINMDEDIMIPIKTINELRREACDELSLLMMNTCIHSHKNEVTVNPQKISYNKKHEYYVFVQNREQFQCVMKYPIDNIIYPFQKDSMDIYQECKKNDKKFILFMPRICKDNNLQEIVQSQLFKKTQCVIVNDYGSYIASQGKEMIIGTGIHIHNSLSSHVFMEKKILSLEMPYQSLSKLRIDHSQAIVQVYGYIENMLSEYCPISQYYFGFQKKNCGLCRQSQFMLKDRKNTLFPLMMDDKCRMHLLNHEPLYIKDTDHIPTKGLFIHFTLENTEEIEAILQNLNL